MVSTCVGRLLTLPSSIRQAWNNLPSLFCRRSVSDEAKKFYCTDASFPLPPAKASHPTPEEPEEEDQEQGQGQEQDVGRHPTFL
jgi:hypothetical protein